MTPHQYAQAHTPAVESLHHCGDRELDHLADEIQHPDLRRLQPPARTPPQQSVTTEPIPDSAVLLVTARVPFGTKAQLKTLKPLFKAEQRWARVLSLSEPWDVRGLSGREAAERRTAWYAHRAELREDGQLLDCLGAVVMRELRAEVRARGWNRDWPPLPAEALRLGRWPGSRDGGYPENIPVRLPAGLVLRVRCACWHTSAEAIGQLRDWRDRWPDAQSTKAFRGNHENQALAEFEELAAQVITTGEIWRSAFQRLVDTVPVLLRRAAATA